MTTTLLATLRRHPARVRFVPFRLELGPGGTLILALATWGWATYGLPLIAPSFQPAEAWGVAAVTILTLLASLVAHALAHTLAARQCGGPLPEHVALGAFGDAAQSWPAAPDPAREVACALAGPLANMTLAGALYLVWEAQPHPYVNAVALVGTLANLGLALVNLAPGFPLDGGRLTGAIVWGLLGTPRGGRRWARRIGRLLIVALACWGIYLLTLGARFSLATGAGTLLIAGLLLAGQLPAAWHWNRPSPGAGLPRLLAWPLTLAAIGGLLAFAASLTPTVDGLYSPGPAVAVSPMVQVPAERAHPPAGAFLLTTVIAQAPITLGQRLFAQTDPAYTLVPPEQVVPVNTTPQELMRRNYRMLEESEATAIVVALRLAGERADLISTGLELVSILPDAPAAATLRAGDLLLRAGDAPTPTVDALRAALAAYRPGDEVELLVERNGRELVLAATLMEPAAPGDPPRLGVSLRPIGLDVDLPFPVSISPEKIVGGPSAGLMFTLAIYDLLTPEDLTRGWRIAGTGTIAIDGTVGPIGGIAQKVAGAEAAGAEYFIVPRQHYAEALRVARDIRLIPVDTAQGALDALRALPPR